MLKKLLFLIIVACVCVVGVLQIVAENKLRRVDQELSNVIPRYWALNWESVNVLSKYTEADSKEYNEHGIPKVLVPENVRSLLSFRQFAVIPSLRANITATLETAQT
jgi:hypothetical protein